jgi:hypothetical protein
MECYDEIVSMWSRYPRNIKNSNILKPKFAGIFNILSSKNVNIFNIHVLFLSKILVIIVFYNHLLSFSSYIPIVRIKFLL